MKTYENILELIESGDYELALILDDSVHYYWPDDETKQVIAVDKVHRQWTPTGFYEADDFFEGSDYNLTWDTATSTWIPAYEKY